MRATENRGGGGGGHDHGELTCPAGAGLLGKGAVMEKQGLPLSEERKMMALGNYCMLVFIVFN